MHNLCTSVKTSSFLYLFSHPLLNSYFRRETVLVPRFLCAIIELFSCFINNILLIILKYDKFTPQKWSKIKLKSRYDKLPLLQFSQFEYWLDPCLNSLWISKTYVYLRHLGNFCSGRDRVEKRICEGNRSVLSFEGTVPVLAWCDRKNLDKPQPGWLTAEIDPKTFWMRSQCLPNQLDYGWLVCGDTSGAIPLSTNCRSHGTSSTFNH